MGFDLDTGREWAQENERNISRFYADENGRWLAGLSSDQVKKEANLILKNANTLELTYEIRDLEEFSSSTDRYALSRDFRWAYACGEALHLLTISDQRTELWVREIPSQ